MKTIEDQQSLAETFNSLASTILLVLNEEGENIENARLRQTGDAWIYCDDQNGWSTLDSISGLNLLEA